MVNDLLALTRLMSALVNDGLTPEHIAHALKHPDVRLKVIAECDPERIKVPVVFQRLIEGGASLGEIREVSIADLGLEPAVRNELNRNGVLTVGQLAELTENSLMSYRYIGVMRIAKIRLLLESIGLHLSRA